MSNYEVPGSCSLPKCSYFNKKLIPSLGKSVSQKWIKMPIEPTTMLKRNKTEKFNFECWVCKNVGALDWQNAFCVNSTVTERYGLRDNPLMQQSVSPSKGFFVGGCSNSYTCEPGSLALREAGAALLVCVCPVPWGEPPFHTGIVRQLFVGLVQPPTVLFNAPLDEGSASSVAQAASHTLVCVPHSLVEDAGSFNNSE